MCLIGQRVDTVILARPTQRKIHTAATNPKYSHVWVCISVWMTEKKGSEGKVSVRFVLLLPLSPLLLPCSKSFRSGLKSGQRWLLFRWRVLWVRLQLGNQTALSKDGAQWHRTGQTSSVIVVGFFCSCCYSLLFLLLFFVSCICFILYFILNLIFTANVHVDNMVNIVILIITAFCKRCFIIMIITIIIIKGKQFCVVRKTTLFFDYLSNSALSVKAVLSLFPPLSCGYPAFTPHSPNPGSPHFVLPSAPSSFPMSVTLYCIVGSFTRHLILSLYSVAMYRTLLQFLYQIFFYFFFRRWEAFYIVTDYHLYFWMSLKCFHFVFVLWILRFLAKRGQGEEQQCSLS